MRFFLLLLLVLSSSLLGVSRCQSADNGSPSNEAATTVVPPANENPPPLPDTPPEKSGLTRDEREFSAMLSSQGMMMMRPDAHEEFVPRVCACIPNGWSSCPFRIPAGIPFTHGTTNLRFPSVSGGGCGSSGSAVHYAFAPSTVTRNILATTCHPGTTFDTVISVSANGGVSWSSCNDDYCGLRSQIVFTIPANNANYRLRVSGFSSRVGDFMLQVTDDDYSQTFLTGTVLQSSPACTRFNSQFRAGINPSVAYHRVWLSSSLNTTGADCTAAPAANAICQALRSGLGTTQFCDGQTWRVGPQNSCNNGVELTTNALCSCSAGVSLRPCINNANWGGFGTTCGASSQTIQLACF